MCEGWWRLVGVRRTNSHSYLMSDFARLAAAHSQSIFANGVSIFQRRRSERFDSHNRAATGGKTAKREVLPGFCKIKHSSSSGGTVADATTVAVLPVKHMPWWPCHKIYNISSRTKTVRGCGKTPTAIPTGNQKLQNSTSKQTVFCHVVFNENKSPVYFSYSHE